MAQNSGSKHGGNGSGEIAAERLSGSNSRRYLRTLLLAALTVTASLTVQAQTTEGSTQSKSSKPAAAKPVKFEKPKTTVSCMPAPPFEKAAGTSPTQVVSWRDCADTPELVRLRGGKFLMGEQGKTGTLYELPVREVAVSEFSIGKYEVSFDEWDQCYAAGGCLKQADDEGWGRGQRPVINVSWVDAQQYVHWLSEKTGRKYRLLTEAEWEYAARAGTHTRYHWGDGAEWSCSLANVLDLTGVQANPHWHWGAYCDDSFAATAPVGSFKPNRWGLHDMNGNVWEWVQDCWHSDYTGAPRDSSAWVTGGECGKRVNRGGGWGNHPRSMRSASRDADSAEGYGDAIGFRVARSP